MFKNMTILEYFDFLEKNPGYERVDKSDYKFNLIKRKICGK